MFNIFYILQIDVNYLLISIYQYETQIGDEETNISIITIIHKLSLPLQNDSDVDGDGTGDNNGNDNLYYYFSIHIH